MAYFCERCQRQHLSRASCRVYDEHKRYQSRGAGYVEDGEPVGPQGSETNPLGSTKFSEVPGSLGYQNLLTFLGCISLTDAMDLQRRMEEKFPLSKAKGVSA